jgi:hypothetical protein
MRVDACLVRQQLPLLEMICHACPNADRSDYRIIFYDSRFLFATPELAFCEMIYGD